MHGESRPVPGTLPHERCKIVGAGVIGLSLALELRRRGASVTVIDRGPALPPASAAAAGMLAVEDPYNPPELLPLSRLSGAMYPEFLARLEELSGLHVPFQTNRTLQTMPNGTVQELAEHSLDPRQLAPALRLAAERAGVQIVAHDYAPGARPGNDAETEVYTAGAWHLPSLPAFLQITPRKGQMLRVKLPKGSDLHRVHRREHGYVVPRNQGPQAGTALIGATVEEAGFDLTTSPASLLALRLLGAELVPELADAARAPMVEAWAGLRPTTPDLLPLLGVLSGGLSSGLDRPGMPPVTRAGMRPGSGAANHRTWIATGHFRNGILLAPATARVMADLIEGRPSLIDLRAFSPTRFGPVPSLP